MKKRYGKKKKKIVTKKWNLSSNYLEKLWHYVSTACKENTGQVGDKEDS